ncbi:MAG: tRNA (adenosine(37)-N6)-threonylcarbamoyltransferase complex ATPase subunit type 1 TsaE [Eubacteriales bacterium]|nr:tRNA (adenosine(37)-N6)-threonylcarbamoyltransferase complex ATPase subunit type 1 TsaE [Eubacteriales bacterium]
MEIIETRTSEETFQLGKKLGETAQRGDIYALVGDLGVGKTVFSKGFAEGLAIDEVISSPTFTLINEYQGGRLPLYHFDIYRIEEAEELDAIGFQDYIYGNGVCLVEWANRIPEIFPEHTVWIKIEKDYMQEDYRKVSVARQPAEI